MIKGEKFKFQNYRCMGIKVHALSKNICFSQYFALFLINSEDFPRNIKYFPKSPENVSNLFEHFLRVFEVLKEFLKTSEIFLYFPNTLQKFLELFESYFGTFRKTSEKFSKIFRRVPAKIYNYMAKTFEDFRTLPKDFSTLRCKSVMLKVNVRFFGRIYVIKGFIVSHWFVFFVRQ